MTCRPLFSTLTKAELNITIVQTTLFWESPNQNKNHLSALLKNVAPTDLIVLPELFTTAFSMTAKAESMQGDSVAWLKELARQKNALIIGSILIEENNKLYNRLICMFPNGNCSHYDKRHLFSMMKEDEVISKGGSRIVIEHLGWKICPLVCYDLRFPVYSRNNHEYDVLLYTANWPLKRIKHWTKLLNARAIENQSYVIGVNRIGEDGNKSFFNGKSAVFDFDGELVLDCESAETCSIVTISKEKLIQYRERLPFLKDQYLFTIH